MDNTLTCLYRAFNKSKKLLYVGISNDFPRRLKEHEKASSWYQELETLRIEYHATREQAEEAEARAIVTENPIYNIVYNVALCPMLLNYEPVNEDSKECAKRLAVAEARIRDLAKEVEVMSRVIPAESSIESQFVEQLNQVKKILVSGKKLKFKQIRDLGIGHNFAQRIRVELERDGYIVAEGRTYRVK